MARYHQLEQTASAEKSFQEKERVKSALTRFYNKMSTSELVDALIDYKPDYLNYLGNGKFVGYDQDPLTYLHVVNNATWRAFREFIHLTKWPAYQKVTIINIARQIGRVSDTFFLDAGNIKALKGISDIYEEYRICDIEDWKPRRNAAQHQLPDLLNFLFARYPVPAFLVNSFTKYDLTGVLLYAHIGQGRAIKKFDFHPDMVLSNKCYHFLNSTPDHCSINAAYRRAQILSLGGSENLFRVMMASRIGRDDTADNITKFSKIKDEFIVSIIRFFIDNPMIDEVKIGEIVDYIYDQKYNKCLPELRENNVWVSVPRQPNFCMKGRTPMSLLHHSDEWHRAAAEQLRRVQREQRNERIHRMTRSGFYKAPPESWTANHLIKNYKFVNNKNFYEIKQLTTYKDLQFEGQQMSHCVATYASSCSSGTCTIFSLRWTNKDKDIFNSPQATVEVRGFNVVQVKAKCNKKPDVFSMGQIKIWADENSLNINKYL